MTDLIGRINPDGSGRGNWVAHTRRHGGYAAQAKRRDEQWIQCTGCTQRAHKPEYHQPEPESMLDFVKAFGTFALLILSLYVFVLAGAAWVAYR